jgi:putative DNA primase/helicase
MIGYTMYRRNELGKAFILVGDGSNGKSTLLNMIKGILGRKNIAALDIKELDERFKTWKLYGKLANLGDDISSRYINDSSFFKKLATGDLVTAEMKGKDAFEFSNYATMIYSANKLPKTSDKSDGFYRRFTPIPLKAKFSKQNNNFDLEIVDRLKEDKSLEYLAYISLQKFKKVLKRQCFTTPLVVKEMIERYKIQNSNVLLFLDDYESDIKKTYLTELYLAYQTWCKESGHKHCSKGEFKTEIYDYGYEPSDTAKRINGKVKKYFVEVKK